MPGIPMLGLIPKMGEWRDRKRPYLVAQTHAEVAALRGLPGTSEPPSSSWRWRIPPMSYRSPARSAGDGKTTTSANLAWIMADAGQRVVLIDCDLRQPRIHEFFGLPNDVGFTSVLLGRSGAGRRAPFGPQSA